MTRHEIKITAMPLDPLRCQFTVDRPVVYAGGTFHFQNKEKAKGSPLAEELFTIEGIAAIQLSGNQVTAATATPVVWKVVGKDVGRILREYLISEAAHFEQTLADAKGDSTAQIRLRVQRVLDTQINPSVSSHGGKITLLDVKDATAYIKMEGGCHGCGMSSVTLKSGIEKAILQNVPEIKSVLDTTDHESGNNPYYAPSKK